MILLNPAHGVKNTWLNSNKEGQTRIISQAWKTKATGIYKKGRETETVGVEPAMW